MNLVCSKCGNDKFEYHPWQNCAGPTLDSRSFVCAEYGTRNVVYLSYPPSRIKLDGVFDIPDHMKAGVNSTPDRCTKGKEADS